MAVATEEVRAGQAVYNSWTLKLYDLVVLGVSNRWIWRCPTSRLLEHYNRHVTDNHLDVGVGSGYFPDKCKFPSERPRVGLMDLNESSLRFAATRILRYSPSSFQCNVLEPIPQSIRSSVSTRFSSIAVNYLLHCLPGTIGSKSVVFDHLAELLIPDAVIFGSTLLSAGVSRTYLAKRLMNAYNARGIFSNEHDSLETLESELHKRFRTVSVEVVGCCAIFSARGY